MENILFKLILKAKIEKQLIAISTDKDDTDKFAVGFVKNFDDTTLVLQAVDPEGTNDGLIIINIDDIYIVNIGDKYLEQLSLFHDKSNELSKEEIFEMTSNKKTVLFLSIIEKCISEKLLISINLIYDRGIIGYINESDDEFISITNVTESGETDGVSCVKISDIERIYIDSIDLRKIKLLQKYFYS